MPRRSGTGWAVGQAEDVAEIAHHGIERRHHGGQGQVFDSEFAHKNIPPIFCLERAAPAHSETGPLPRAHSAKTPGRLTLFRLDWVLETSRRYCSTVFGKKEEVRRLGFFLHMGVDVL